MKTPFLAINTKLGQCVLKRGTTPDEVISFLGVPTNSWDDGVEHCLQYETEDLELRVYWTVWQLLWMKHLRFKHVDVEFLAPPLFKNGRRNDVQPPA